MIGVEEKPGPPEPPEPDPIPDPEGNWMDAGNFDTTWYHEGKYEISTAKELALRKGLFIC
jgi:hypothetical protein